MKPRPKPFNITLLHPPGFIHAHALKEAADYVHATIRACGYQSIRTVNHVAGDAHNVIFCAHLLKRELIEKIPPDTIVFNSESLEDSGERQFYSDAYGELLGRFYVWDYSYRNLPLIPHDKKAVIPFLHCEELKRSDIPRRHGSSLLFYGRMTERRRDVLNGLQRRGVPVKAIFGEYDFQRDLHMLGAWAILNLHKSDDTRAFEPIRCFYPLINGIPVISEGVIDASADAFKDAVFFLERGALIEGISALCANRQDFDERSRAMLAKFTKKDPLPAMAAAIEKFLGRCEG